MELTRKNPSGLSDLAQHIDGFKGLEVKIGWFQNSAYPDDRPVAAVAAGNELGIASRSIPPRPFMRPTAIDKQNVWREDAAVLAARALDGKITPFAAMDALGAIAEADIAKTIASITTPPLSPITLGARKYRQQGKKVTGATIGEIAGKLKAGTLDVSGVSTKPLEDTFTMLNRLTHETSNV